MLDPAVASQPSSRGLYWLIALASLLIALVSAVPYAGSWNDGSRLAAIESITDYGTLSIDDSIFVAPVFLQKGAPPPYGPDNVRANTRGTLDRLLIDGHWYSDKPYVMQVMLAGVYKAMQVTTGLRANRRPDLFSYAMTVVSNGLSLIVFALAGFVTARRILATDRSALLVTAAFVLGTGAVVYTRHVNSSLPVTAVMMVIVAVLTCRVNDQGELDLRGRRVASLGLLLGLAYALETATGGLLCLAVGLLVAWQCWLRDRKRWHLPILLALTALPFIALHHAFNYRISGMFAPANSNRAFLDWPGSFLHHGYMTGVWYHASVGDAINYWLDLMFGRKGFLWLNPAMMLGVIGGVRMALPGPRRLTIPGASRGQRAILWSMLAWGMALWLLYGALSRDRSGLCYGIRWFLPMLAPGLFAVALTVRHYSAGGRALAALTAGGLVLAGIGWVIGPWDNVRSTYMWPVVIAMMLAWGAVTFFDQLDKFRTRRATKTGAAGPTR